MGADGAARDFAWPLGVTQGDHNSRREHPVWAPDSWRAWEANSPQRALTEEQQRGQAKDQPLLLCLRSLVRSREAPSVPAQSPLRVFVRWLLTISPILAQKCIYE